MSARKLFYLGPQGTFTHQAAVNASQELAHLEPAGFELVALDDVPQILEAVQQGEGWGVVAWENNVEGYVVPNLDALIDAKDLAGFARVGVDVTFDAYVRAGSDPEEATVATAHSHGLAQCKRFIAEHRLRPVPAPSNAAACRDIKANEIALGPSICVNFTTSHASAPPCRIIKAHRLIFLCSHHARKQRTVGTATFPIRYRIRVRVDAYPARHRPWRTCEPAGRIPRRRTQHDKLHLTANQRTYRHLQFYRDA